jgi:hypothetical protein
LKPEEDNVGLVIVNVFVAIAKVLLAIMLVAFSIVATIIGAFLGGTRR